MKIDLKTSINISASKETIWNILLDFKQYPEWNPFIISITGEAKIGEKLNADIGDMKFKPIILEVKKQKELRWIGSSLIKGIVDGEHEFKLSDNPDGTVRFDQNEKFSGILVRFFSKKLNIETKKGFIAMNEALKSRAESA